MQYRISILPTPYPYHLHPFPQNRAHQSKLGSQAFLFPVKRAPFPHVFQTTMRPLRLLSQQRRCFMKRLRYSGPSLASKTARSENMAVTTISCHATAAIAVLFHPTQAVLGSCAKSISAGYTSLQYRCINAIFDSFSALTLARRS
jgi:hypothetical protein